MSTYKKIEVPCDVPDLSWFSNFKFPNFKTANVIGLEIRDCDSVNYKNDKGQENNVARSTGTSHLNRDSIKESILSKGIQIDALPPVILEDGTSIDGFTRGQALKSLNQQKWVYTVVKLKDGVNIEDLKDEIGLGCNDHARSKPASTSDFEVRLKNWIVREYSKGNEPTLVHCKNWWNNIPHSFEQKTVEKTCKKVLKALETLNNVESLNKKQAEDKAKDIFGNQIDNKTEVIAINGSKITYLHRALIDTIEAIASGTKVKTVAFLNNVVSDNFDDERAKLVEQMDALNSCLELAFKRYAVENLDVCEDDLEELEPFDFFSFEGFVPQIIDKEPTDKLVTEY